MAGTWAVSSEIVFTSNGAKLFAELTSGARELMTAMQELVAVQREFNALNKVMPAQIGRMTGAFTRQTTRIEAATAAMQQYTVAAKEAGATAVPIGGGSRGAGGVERAAPSIGSRIATGAGLLSAWGAYEGIKAASSLQNSVVQTAIASGRMGNNLDQTQANMAPTVGVAYKMSAMTGGSVADMMEVVQQLTSSGLTLAQVAATYKPIAMATDILHFGKDKASFSDAATTISGAMHSLRLYNEEDTKYGLQRMSQLGYQSPHDTKQLMTQARLFAPAFENTAQGTTQQKADLILTMTSWMDRLGVLQRGGSGLNMLAQYLRHPKTPPQLRAFQDLGITDKQGHTKFENAQGEVDYMGLIRKVSADGVAAHKLVGKAGKAAVDKFNDEVSLLSANASRYFMAFANPQALAMFDKLKQTTAAMPNLAQMQSQLMDTLGHATQRLGTNMESLLMTAVMPLVPALTKFVGALATATGNLSQFLFDHKGVAGVAGTALAGGALFGIYKAMTFMLHLFGENGVVVRALMNKVGVEGAEHGAIAASRTGGLLSGIGDLLFGMTGLKGTKLESGITKLLSPLSKIGSLFGVLGQMASRLFIPLAIVMGGFNLFRQMFEHPVNFGIWVGGIEGWFKYTLPSLFHNMFKSVNDQAKDKKGFQNPTLVSEYFSAFALVWKGLVSMAKEIAGILQGASDLNPAEIKAALVTGHNETAEIFKELGKQRNDNAYTDKVRKMARERAVSIGENTVKWGLPENQTAAERAILRFRAGQYHRPTNVHASLLPGYQHHVTVAPRLTPLQRNVLQRDATENKNVSAMKNFFGTFWKSFLGGNRPDRHMPQLVRNVEKRPAVTMVRNVEKRPAVTLVKNVDKPAPTIGSLQITVNPGGDASVAGSIVDAINNSFGGRSNGGSTGSGSRVPKPMTTPGSSRGGMR